MAKNSLAGSLCQQSVAVSSVHGAVIFLVTRCDKLPPRSYFAICFYNIIINWFIISLTMWHLTLPHSYITSIIGWNHFWCVKVLSLPLVQRLEMCDVNNPPFRVYEERQDSQIELKQTYSRHVCYWMIFFWSWFLLPMLSASLSWVVDLSVFVLSCSDWAHKVSCAELFWLGPQSFVCSCLWPWLLVSGAQQSCLGSPQVYI